MTIYISPNMFAGSNSWYALCNNKLFGGENHYSKNLEIIRVTSDKFSIQVPVATEMIWLPDTIV